MSERSDQEAEASHPDEVSQRLPLPSPLYTSSRWWTILLCDRVQSAQWLMRQARAGHHEQMTTPGDTKRRLLDRVVGWTRAEVACIAATS